MNRILKIKHSAIAMYFHSFTLQGTQNTKILIYYIHTPIKEKKCFELVFLEYTEIL